MAENTGPGRIEPQSQTRSEVQTLSQPHADEEKYTAGLNKKDAGNENGGESSESVQTVDVVEEEQVKVKKFGGIRNNGVVRRIWEVVSWTPKRCRYDPKEPPRFSMSLNLLFAFVSCSHIRFDSLTMKRGERLELLMSL